MEASALIRQARTTAGLTQAQLAERAGVKQPVIARLERPGANPRFETLTRVMEAASHNLRVELQVEPGIDETLIAENLRLSPEERLRQFEAAYRSVAELATTARTPEPAPPPS